MNIESIKKLIKEGDIPQARSQLREVLVKTPEDAVAQMLYGTCCQIMGDPETFGRIYQKLAPEMKRCVERGEKSERISMWLKYAAMIAMIFTLGCQTYNAYERGGVDSDDDTEEVAPRKREAKKSKKKALEATRMFVAIAKFENKSEAPDALFETICIRVQQCVEGARKFEVVEREKIKAAMSEANLAVSGVTNAGDPTVTEMGKMKVAGFVVYGTVLYCGKDKAGGASEGVASATAKSKVELQIKITDAETGKILAQKSAIGFGSDKAIATEGYKSATNQGMRDAIDEAAHMAADALRDVAYPAKIVSVNEDDEVIINMTNEEVKEGDVFDVIDAKDLGYVEDTGAWRGFGGKTIGRVKVESTDAQTSTAEPTTAEPTMGRKGKMLGLKDLDLDEHTYILRRVSKETLERELEPYMQRPMYGGSQFFCKPKPPQPQKARPQYLDTDDF